MASRDQQHDIQQSKILQAAAMTPAERFHAGFELFEMVRRRMLAGIRSEYPNWAESQIEEEFRQRLRLQRERQEKSIYKVVETSDGT